MSVTSSVHWCGPSPGSALKVFPWFSGRSPTPPRWSALAIFPAPMAVVASQSITDLWACPPTYNLFTRHGQLLFERYSLGKQKIKNAGEERKSSAIGCFWNYKFKKPLWRRVWSPELSNYSSPGCVTKGRGSSVPERPCTPVFITVTRANLGASRWMEG